MNTTDVRDLKGKRAGAWFNGDFISVESNAFHRSAGIDPQGARHFLPPDAVDEWLGEAVLNALHCSRFLSLDEARVFFALRQIEPAYAAWRESLMKRYGYKSKRLLFRNMLHCTITSTDDTIEIKPTLHRELEGWSGFPAEDEVESIVIPIESSAAEIGAAVRMAFDRCH